MKYKGIVTLIKKDLVTGKETVTVKENQITMNTYANSFLLKNQPAASSPCYIWIGAHREPKTKRLYKNTMKPHSLLGEYGYMATSEWFSRLIEDEYPNYSEYRARFNPDSSGEDREINTIYLSINPPRAGTTGLNITNSAYVKTSRDEDGSTTTLVPINVYAYVSLDEPCTQGPSEVLDVYYRIVYEDVDSNLSNSAISFLAKSYISKSPWMKYVLTLFRLSSSVNTNEIDTSSERFNFFQYIPNEYSQIDHSLAEDGTEASNSSNASMIFSSSYLQIFRSNLTQFIGEGKIFQNIQATTGNGIRTSLSLFSIIPKNLHKNGERTIWNTHGHYNNTKIFFDPDRLSRGYGKIRMESTSIPEFSEYIKVKIEDSGSLNSFGYKITRQPYTGSYWGKKEGLAAIMHIPSTITYSQGEAPVESYRGLHGLTNGKGGSSMLLNNLECIRGAWQCSGFPNLAWSINGDIVPYGKSSVLGYSDTGLCIFYLDGKFKILDEEESPTFNANAINQISLNDERKMIFIACKNTGLWKAQENSTGISYELLDVKNNAFASSSNCYGVFVSKSDYNEITCLMDDGLYFSSNEGVSFSKSLTFATDINIPIEECYGIKRYKDLSNDFIILNKKKDVNDTTAHLFSYGLWDNILEEFSYVSLSSSPLSGNGSSNINTPNYLGPEYFDLLDSNIFFLMNGTGFNTGRGIYKSQIGYNSATKISTSNIPFGNTINQVRFMNIKESNYLYYSSENNLYYYNYEDNTESLVSSHGKTNRDLGKGVTIFPIKYGVMLSSGLFVSNTKGSNIVPLTTSGEYNQITGTESLSNYSYWGITNPFFEKDYSMFEETYGWNGSSWELDHSGIKTFNSGPNTFDNINILAEGEDDPLDFIEGDHFSTIRLEGFSKDNASILAMYFTNSFLKESSEVLQTGTIENSLSESFFLKRPDICNLQIEVDNTPLKNRFIIGKTIEASKSDYCRWQGFNRGESKTIGFTVDEDIGSFEMILSNNTYSVSGDSGSGYGIAFYRKADTSLYARYISAPKYNSFSYRNSLMTGTEFVFSVGDKVEIRIEDYRGTSSTYGNNRFSLYKNGTVIANYAGWGYSSNSLTYSDLTICPRQETVFPLYLPEFMINNNHSDQPEIVTAPLKNFQEDKDSLAISPYDPNTMKVIIDGNEALYSDISYSKIGTSTIFSHVIPMGHYFCSVESGMISFSKEDIGKNYEIIYKYYIDEEA